ncbi:hypothetical protein HELRODRAFT_174403 [Helobdella robusta]|uniref:Uncharacterized protein n=1 Tax=Helobdella robusta TaxID=6412 RepID=T1F831_HELRO|nr:hypothetical protein HELRODRAFT_174403 [Helobdella robusta]ESO02928.1 hypothetical protein HELRODRAFT_174403 [Helobdella robusta]
MDFLFELVQSYQYMKVNGSYPAIKFKSAIIEQCQMEFKSNLCSPGIYFKESNNNQLCMVCDFIASAWSDIWFSDIQYLEHNFNNLEQAITSTTAMKTLKTFCSQEPSRIQEIQRSNI